MTDRDLSLLSVLDRYTPAAPGDYPVDWNDVLRRAAPVPRRRRRRPAVAVLLVAAAVAAVLLAVTPWSTSPDIVGRAAAALTPPPRTVLHIETRDTQAAYPSLSPPLPTVTWDMWFNRSGGYRGFTDLSGSRVEFGGGTRFEESVQYNPATKEIGPTAVNHIYTAFGNPQSEIRKELGASTAHVDGKATINGRELLRIRLQDFDENCKPTISYLFVDPKTYAPVERSLVRSGTPSVTTFLLYERLPATPANLRLTSVQQMHPTAKAQPPASSYPPPPPEPTCPKKR